MWPGKAYHFLSGGDGLEEKVKLYFIYTTAGRRRKRNRKSPRSNSYEQKQEIHLSGPNFRQKFVLKRLAGGLYRDGL